MSGILYLVGTPIGNLGDLSALLRSIAGGDLTRRMEGDYRGVFAQMRDDANATVDKLVEIVGKIKQSSDTITTAAGEIVHYDFVQEIDLRPTHVSGPPNAARSKQVCFPTYWHHAHSSMAPRLSW